MWICPTCGRTNNPWQHISDAKWDPTIPPDQIKDQDWCPDRAVRVRVFREEHVRPLWEAARAVETHGGRLPVIRAVAAFPAPEEWSQ